MTISQEHHHYSALVSAVNTRVLNFTKNIDFINKIYDNLTGNIDGEQRMGDQPFGSAILMAEDLRSKYNLTMQNIGKLYTSYAMVGFRCKGEIGAA